MLTDTQVKELLELKSQIENLWKDINKFLKQKESPVFIWEERDKIRKIKEKCISFKSFLTQLRHQVTRLQYTRAMNELQELESSLDGLEGSNSFVQKIQSHVENLSLIIDRICKNLPADISRREVLRMAAGEIFLPGSIPFQNTQSRTRAAVPSNVYLCRITLTNVRNGLASQKEYLNERIKCLSEFGKLYNAGIFRGFLYEPSDNELKIVMKDLLRGRLLETVESATIKAIKMYHENLSF